LNAHAEALALHGVGKCYRGRGQTVQALDGVELAVPAGTLFALVGHNGAGKSTLFKLLLGLIEPSAGRVTVGGVDVGGRRFREVRRGIGYLPENLVLWDNLSGVETMRLFARLKGAPAAECEPLLERVGLGAAASRPVRGYSKGMRQRLGFAQALLGEPKLLLLDEPTTGLDPLAVREFYAELDALRARGTTIVVSSHILAELQERVDALALLAQGRVRAQGSVQALRERSAQPLRVQISGVPAAIAGLAGSLPPGVRFVDRDGEHALLECPRLQKMALLARLAGAGLSDLVVREPSLEDVYFGLQQGGELPVLAPAAVRPEVHA